jgi:Zn-finger nucleic acid-binding protein/ribosomal protein L40E
LRLVACTNCHTQYDVSEIVAKSFPCRCGETVENSPHEAVDAQIHRCGSCGALVTPDAESCEYCGSAIVRDTRNLSLICPECYARSTEDSRFCTACGVAFRPEQVQVEGFELPCPVCTVLMPPRQLGGVGLNECTSCSGLWVPDESFDLLVSRAIEARRNADPAQLIGLKPRVSGSNPATQRVQYRKCPVCDGYMQRRNFRKSSGVIIDVCWQHGTWLDADELEQIAGFILSGGTTAPTLVERPSQEARASAEFARIRAQNQPTWQQPAGQGGVVGSFVDVLAGLFRAL